MVLAARVIRGFILHCRASDKRRKCIAPPPFDKGPFRNPESHRLSPVLRSGKRARSFVRIFASDWRRFGLERRNFAGRVAPAGVICSRTSGARDNLPWARAKCSAHEAPLRFRKNAPRRVVLMTRSHTCLTLHCPTRRLARQSVRYRYNIDRIIWFLFQATTHVEAMRASADPLVLVKKSQRQRRQNYLRETEETRLRIEIEKLCRRINLFD